MKRLNSISSEKQNLKGVLLKTFEFYSEEIADEVLAKITELNL